MESIGPGSKSGRTVNRIPQPVGVRRGISIVCALALALVACGCGGASAGPPPQTSPSVSLLPGALDFGNTGLGTTTPAQNIALQNTGTAALAINSISPTGDYSVVNNCGASLAPGASCTLSITFTPTAPGTRPGAVQITDNASNSPQSATLTGTGIGIGLHAVLLSWTLSQCGVVPCTPPQVIGYFAYHSTQSGGPYDLLNSVPTTATTTSFQDQVAGGQTWYFIVTAVDANLVESIPSNEVAAVVPP